MVSMVFTWQEYQNGSNYSLQVNVHNTTTSDTFKCPECCIGGVFFSQNYTLFELGTPTQCNCIKGIEVYYCTCYHNEIQLLTFPCNETQNLDNIWVNEFSNFSTGPMVIPSSLFSELGYTPMQSSAVVTQNVSPTSLPSNSSSLNSNISLLVIIILIFCFRDYFF